MLIYFRWCQSFHYKPHFSEVYNLAIKMLRARGSDYTTHSCLSPFPGSRQGHPASVAQNKGWGRRVPRLSVRGGEDGASLPLASKLCAPTAAHTGLLQASKASPQGRRATHGAKCMPAWESPGFTVIVPQKCSLQGHLGAVLASPLTQRPDRSLSDRLPR